MPLLSNLPATPVVATILTRALAIAAAAGSTGIMDDFPVIDTASLRRALEEHDKKERSKKLYERFPKRFMVMPGNYVADTLLRFQGVPQCVARGWPAGESNSDPVGVRRFTDLADAQAYADKLNEERGQDAAKDNANAIRNHYAFLLPSGIVETDRFFATEFGGWVSPA